jgi:predicted permease
VDALMHGLGEDLRYAVRLLLKHRGFTLIAVATLGLGVGVNTAIFSVVNAVFLRQLPVPDAHELVFGFEGTRSHPWQTTSYPTYRDYRERSGVFADLAAYGPIRVSLSSDERPDLVQGAIVTGNYFEVLGVAPAQGSLLSPADDQAPNAHPVAVISHRLWQGRFQGSPAVVGRELRLNGRPFTVKGVAPRGFEGAELLERTDVYVPMMMQAVVRPPRGGYAGEMDPDLLNRRGGGWLRMLGRLKPGVTLAAAQANVARVSAELAQAYADTHRERGVTLFPVTRIDPRGYRPLVSAAVLLLGVTGIVLLITCANVANLLLARAAARRREIAVRLALGAGRRRVARQLLTESVLLACLGGSVGVLFAAWTVELLQATPPRVGVFSFALDFGLDGRVFAFALLLSLLTGIVFGLAPAWRAARSDVASDLKDAGAAATPRARRFGLQNCLVVAQMSLSVVSLLCAGLFLRSLQRIQAVDPGFDAERVLTGSLDVDLLRYSTAQGREFYRRAVERVAALPGVERASLARIVPIAGGGRFTAFSLAPEPGTPDAARAAATPCAANVVGIGYFDTMGIPIVAGRDFGEQDATAGAGVVIVNQTFVRRHLGGQDPVGRRIRVGIADPTWREIVGVARDSKYRMLSEDATPFIYQPLAQNHETGMALLVRSADPASVAPAARTAVQSLEPNLPLGDLQPLSELLDSALYPSRMAAALLSALGSLALLLAAVGLYGVMSYSVAQRTREIGARMALGARVADVVRLVLRRALGLVGVGLALGWIAAAAVSRVLAGFLFGIDALDPLTFIAVPFVLVVAGLLASYLPARRAARVDPVLALRCD